MIQSANEVYDSLEFWFSLLCLLINIAIIEALSFSLFAGWGEFGHTGHAIKHVRLSH